MDVFELTADKQAREQKEREARWRQLVAKQNAADSTKCGARVYGSGRYGSFHGHSCGKTAKFHREEAVAASYDGTKAPTAVFHYCGIHDPISQKERNEKKWAAERKERDEKYAREQRAYERSRAVANACRHLSNRQCALLATFLDTLYTVNPGAQFDAAFEQVLGVGQVADRAAQALDAVANGEVC